MSDRSERSAPALIGDLLRHVTELLSKEIQLLRAEISEKTNQAVIACGMIVAAIVFALTALNVLSAALVAAIANLGISGGWAALIVGGGLAAFSLALAAKGVEDLKASNLALERTASSVADDVRMAKEKVQ